MKPARRLPPLKALRALEAIHETGSVMAAATRLAVSHSAISHQIKVLENWTPQPLFFRRGRMTLLTDAGKSLASVAHQAFDSIRHEMDRLPMRGMRTVSIASLPIVATHWLVPRLKAIRTSIPTVNLHLSFAQTDWPVTPQPDIEIRFAQREHLRKDDIVLFSGDAVPVCAPGLLRDNGNDPMTVMTTAPLIHDEDLRMWERWIDDFGDVAKVSRQTSGLIVEGSTLLRAAALAGHGIAICRAAFLDDDLRTGRLIRLSAAAIDADWCYFIRHDTSRQPDATVEEVISWLIGADNRAATG